MMDYIKYGNIRLDIGRYKRTGIPEFVYGNGKTLPQLKSIVAKLLTAKHPIIITRCGKDNFQKLQKTYPFLNYNEKADIAFFIEKRKKKNGKKQKTLAVITAGSSDIAVAEEAAVLLELFGCRVERFYDCGVAGIKRITDIVKNLNKAQVVICVAGMDGVLPTITAGLIKSPVIAVPTSIGHGANFKGLAALLTMLNACAPGISVVNIDSGFSAACFALKMLNS